MRREDGKTYRKTLVATARESGIETPSTDDLIRMDRQRKGKKLPNADWTSPFDSNAKIAKTKDGPTYLTYKPQQGVDLDTGDAVAAEIPTAEKSDTSRLPGTLMLRKRIRPHRKIVRPNASPIKAMTSAAS